MKQVKYKYYPTALESVHILILYVFLQALVEFPLAIYDYQNDTNLLSGSWITTISNTIITLFILYFGYRKSKDSFKTCFAIKGFNPFILLAIGILFIGLQFAVSIINVFITTVLPTPSWFEELFERVFNEEDGFWGAFVSVSIIAPIIEESLFRGIIMHGLMRNYKYWYAILLSAILFSLFHMNPWQMSYTFFLGIVLGILMVRTKSLPLCIFSHSLNNFIVLVSITYPEEILNMGISKLAFPAKLILSFAAIVTSLGVIYIMTRKKKDTRTQISSTM